MTKLDHTTDPRITLLPEATRNEMLMLLTQWADSEAGIEYRTGLAHARQPAAWTAEDVLALLGAEEAAEIRILMYNL